MKNRKYSLIENDLAKTICVVMQHVGSAGISTSYVVGERTVDVISDYKYWPDGSFQWEFERFEALMRCLNAAIGKYEARREVARREEKTLLYKIGRVMRWPKIALEYSGLAHGESAGEKALTFWKWIVPYAIGVFTGVVTSSLWGKLFKLVQQAYAKVADAISGAS